jgi:hypothetical protein
MNGKAKLARQRKAAFEIADIMLASLQQFPEAEQEDRIRRIEKVRIVRKPAGKRSKRVSTPRSPRARRLPAKCVAKARSSQALIASSALLARRFLFLSVTAASRPVPRASVAAENQRRNSKIGTYTNGNINPPVSVPTAAAYSARRATRRRRDNPTALRRPGRKCVSATTGGVLVPFRRWLRG